jgi:glycosyltransferase involved in cell wall biosynthesis
MKRLSVLITSSYYWPEGAGTAPYLTGLAEYLSDRGHTVVVATTFAHYPEWRSSANGRFRETEVLRGVVVRRRSHFVPRRQSAGQRALYEATLFGGGLTAIHLRHRPDVVVGTCPSLAAGALARAAAAVYRVPYGLIFQDLMGLAARQSGVAGGDRVASAVRGAELRFARRAERIAIIAEGFRRYFEDGGVEPGRIDRLRNWTRRTEPEETTAETRRRLGWGPDEFVCLHGGNMGQKQGLGNLLAAAELLTDPRIRVVLAGDGNDRARLEEEARKRRLEAVEFIAMQPAGRWEEMMQAADVLLVNQRASVADMSLPSKLTSYFAAGRAVVAAVSADSETAREITEAGAGFVVPPEEPVALRDTIVALAEDPAVASALGEQARVYAQTRLSAQASLEQHEDFVLAVAARTTRT